jgi:hypothetical protein
VIRISWAAGAHMLLPLHYGPILGVSTPRKNTTVVDESCFRGTARKQAMGAVSEVV